jgi:hypothetical protein
LKVALSSGGSLEVHVQNLSPSLGLTIFNQAQLRIANSKLWDSKTSDVEINGG